MAVFFRETSNSEWCTILMPPRFDPLAGTVTYRYITWYIKQNLGIYSIIWVYSIHSFCRSTRKSVRCLQMYPCKMFIVSHSLSPYFFRRRSGTPGQLHASNNPVANARKCHHWLLVALGICCLGRNLHEISYSRYKGEWKHLEGKNLKKHSRKQKKLRFTQIMAINFYINIRTYYQ